MDSKQDRGGPNLIVFHVFWFHSWSLTAAPVQDPKPWSSPGADSLPFHKPLRSGDLQICGAVHQAEEAGFWEGGPAVSRHRPASSGPGHKGSQSWSLALEGLLSPSTGAAGTVTLLPAQALDPAGAGACAKAGEGQRAEPHVLARHNELPKTFLV